MTVILFLLGAGILIWAAIVFGSRSTRAMWIPVGGAIMIGLAVYLMVGRPNYPGHPVAHSLAGADFGLPIADPRKGMVDRFSSVNSWLATSDGLIRTGDTQSATELLQQGIRRNPDNIDLWLAFANALVAHSKGVMTPAAAMAYDKAARLNPDHPGPPFFAGLALAQSGDFAGARKLWTELLQRTPADAPWRDDLTQRLASLPRSESEAANPSAAMPGEASAAATAGPN